MLMEADSFRNFQVITVLLMKRVKEKCSNMRWNIPTKKTLEITKQITNSENNHKQLQEQMNQFWRSSYGVWSIWRDMEIGMPF